MWHSATPRSNKMAEQAKVQEDALNDILSDISDFISLQDGQSFEGKYVRAQKAQSQFDPEKETVELVFEVNSKEKTISGVRLARKVSEAGVKPGDKVKIIRVSTKGTKVEWKVEKVA